MVTLNYKNIAKSNYHILRHEHKTNNLPLNKILCGNCEEILKNFPDNSIDLIFTSPPYADFGKKTYEPTNIL